MEAVARHGLGFQSEGFCTFYYLSKMFPVAHLYACTTASLSVITKEMFVRAQGINQGFSKCIVSVSVTASISIYNPVKNVRIVVNSWKSGIEICRLSAMKLGSGSRRTFGELRPCGNSRSGPF